MTEEKDQSEPEFERLKNWQVFKALSSKTRIRALQIILEEDIHISGLAEKLDISVPVASRHVTILEDSGLIERKKLGSTHVLKAKRDKLRKVPFLFEKYFEIESEQGSSVIDVLRQVSGVKVEKVNDRDYVTSIDGESGYYIYEVNGEIPDESMNKYKIKDDSEIVLKKLVPVSREKISVDVSDKENSQD